MPELSLKPKIKEAKYNAVETYRPGDKTNGLKPNCFSVCDGEDISSGFKDIRVMSRKYKNMKE